MRHHLADALAGEVLEVAGLEDRDDAFLDFLAEQLLLVGRDDLGQRAGRLVDRLGGFEDLLGGLFGAADDGAELAIDLGHFLAVKALAVQRRDFALGAVDGVVDQVELDLELLALFDLGAIGFQQRVGLGDLARDDPPVSVAAALRVGPAPAIWARIARSSAMISRCIGPISPPSMQASGIGASPQNGFFDTKTFAIDRHEIFPPLHFTRVLDRCDLTSRFTPEHVVAALCLRLAHQRLTMSVPRSSQNKRYRPNPRADCRRGESKRRFRLPNRSGFDLY